MEINHRMRTLTENLQKAVAEENYETAASLRDQIKQLESELAS
jgi:protein-arginine kinase activator protein McsA